MPQQQTITTYNFSELSEAVQKKLIESYELSDWWDSWVIDAIKEEAKELGIENFDFQYSGFWSQGDGLSFTGTLSEDLVEKVYKEKVNRDGFGPENPPFTVEFSRTMSSYCHEKTVKASVDGCPDEEDNRFFEEVFNDWKDELCKKWYQMLYNVYEEDTSEERIKEEYEGIQFLEDGRML